jgi:hypothetical protein
MRHRFDPFMFLLGCGLMVIAVSATLGRLDELGDNGWLPAAAFVVFGVSLLMSTVRRSPGTKRTDDT